MGSRMGSLSRAPHLHRYQRSGSRLDDSLRSVAGISRVSQVGGTRRMRSERLSFTLLPFPLEKGPGVRSALGGAQRSRAKGVCQEAATESARRSQKTA